MKQEFKILAGIFGVACVVATVVIAVSNAHSRDESRAKWARYGVETTGKILSVDKRSEFHYNRRRRWYEDVLIIRIGFDGFTGEVKRAPSFQVSSGDVVKVRYLSNDPSGSVEWVH